VWEANRSVTNESVTTRVHAGIPGRGEMTAVDVEGVPVAIANVDGKLHAFDDTCTHRECPLSEGELVGLTVVCPCHRSRFDLATGEVLNPPATRPIRIRSVEVDGDHLVIGA